MVRTPPRSSTPDGSTFITPEIIQPYPKAPSRQENSRRGRKRGRCMIATDTPKKILLEEKMKQKEDKIVNKKLKEAKKKIIQDDSSEDENIQVEYEDNSSDGSLDLEEQKLDKVVSKGDVIVNVYGKACVRKYVAVVNNLYGEEYEVNFMKRNIPSNRFSFTSERSATVSFQDIVAVLPKPMDDKRPRFQGMVYFNIDLSEYSLQ